MNNGDKCLVFLVGCVMSASYVSTPDITHPIAHGILVWILGAGTLGAWIMWREAARGKQPNNRDSGTEGNRQGP